MQRNQSDMAAAVFFPLSCINRNQLPKAAHLLPLTGAAGFGDGVPSLG